MDFGIVMYRLCCCWYSYLVTFMHIILYMVKAELCYWKCHTDIDWLEK